ncbi:DNA primase [Candidatus Omnitrophus magneticus]|uniref:DNA primase n=1 Tax=Candidatus Omnitrophus magneticus TaxID=1609969 RepID=A0A0F0CN34_9BACT|nr:DNA primase [Candidatus Omnitrophus magneticus]
MAKIPQNIIDTILDRSDVVDVISGYVQLKKNGQNFKACCPFHSEKTPSFSVSPSKQIFHCFGCGAGGNVIGFLMKQENLSFVEALEKLADKAGVEIPKQYDRNDENVSISNQIYEINETAALFYQNYLLGGNGNSARSYLKNRGFAVATVKTFRIGLAPDEWESFKNYCLNKKISLELLEKSGLSVRNDKTKNCYDRFRNRIIFPIFNEKGKVIAFAGRVLDNSLPKYVNSPETDAYRKGYNLYGLNFAKDSIREKGYVILVEGYMDVIIPFEHGIKNIVASSGTSLTTNQVRLLKKYTNTAVILFDADAAGENASLRGLDIMVTNNMEVKIATLPKGEDPDTFVRKHGVSSFENIIKSAKNIFDYKLDLLLSKIDSKDSVGKVKIKSEMLPTISLLSDHVLKSAYLSKLAEKLDVNEESLRLELKKVKNDYSYRYENERKFSDAEPRNYIKSELYLLGLAVSNYKWFQKLKQETDLKYFKDIVIKKIILDIEKLYLNDNLIDVKKIIQMFGADDLCKNVIIKAISEVELIKERDKAFSDCVKKIKYDDKYNELKDLNERLKLVQGKGNVEEMRIILSRLNELYKEKHSFQKVN